MQDYTVSVKPAHDTVTVSRRVSLLLFHSIFFMLYCPSQQSYLNNSQSNVTVLDRVKTAQLLNHSLNACVLWLTDEMTTPSDQLSTRVTTRHKDTTASHPVDLD